MQSFSNLILEGGIEASISIAWLGDPLKAPRTSLRCSCAASSLLPLEIEKDAEIGEDYGFCHFREVLSIF